MTLRNYSSKVVRKNGSAKIGIFSFQNNRLQLVLTANKGIWLGFLGEFHYESIQCKLKVRCLHKVNNKGIIMSLINILEQMGSNSALKNLSAEDLSNILHLSDLEDFQLKSIFDATQNQISELYSASKYQCIMQAPAEDEESEEPKEQDNTKNENTAH